MLTALTRQVSPQLDRCELEFNTREPIDVSKAIAQHRGYERTLESLGARVISLPALDGYPDCVFVEDPAIVLDEIAILTRMGAASRRGESESLGEALALYRPLAAIAGPATLEGGDVFRIGKSLYVGLSRRTNDQGIRQLTAIVEPLGYRVIPVPIAKCLHLKSACCPIGGDSGAPIVLANRDWFDASALESSVRIIGVPPAEPAAADVLRIGDTILIPSSFPQTRALLESSGFRTRPIDVSELQKAEAGVTCMSLIWRAGFSRREASTSP